jgi:hypothetical protein
LATELRKFAINDPKEGFIPYESGFNLGLGFLNGLPRKYGQIKFELVTTGASHKRKKSSIPVKQFPCSSDTFTQSNTTWSFSKLACSDAFSNLINGDFFSPAGSQYIEFKVIPCTGSKCAPKSKIRQFFQKN